MKVYHQKVFSFMLSSLIVLSGWLSVAADSLAAEMPVTLACTLDGRSELKKGVAVTFVCSVTSETNRTYTTMLLAKQSLNNVVTAASSAHLSLGVKATTQTKIEFPAIYQPGSYTYTFSLMDIESKSAIAEEIQLMLPLAGSTQATLGEVVPDKIVYQWGESVNLTVSLETSGDEAVDMGKLSLSAALQSALGDNCLMLVENRPVGKSNDTYTLNLPRESSCTNGLAVTLRDESGSALDRKVVALGLPAATVDVSQSSEKGTQHTDQGQGGFSLNFLWISAVGGVLILLIGYLVLRRRSV